MSEAVVLVSGGSAITPFTTPDAACGSGQAAGSTHTLLREQLLAAGHAVYTAPAAAGAHEAAADTGFAGFDLPPQVLPAELTVDALGTIDDAGEHLAAFLRYLVDRFGHQRLHLVGHSMGGLFSTSAIARLGDTSIPVASLTTIGTPWCGAFAADYVAGDLPLSAAGGDQRFETVMSSFAEEMAALPSPNAGEQVAGRFVNGWLASHLPALNGIPITMIAGTAFTGDGAMWPNDGLVTTASASATDITAPVLAAAVRHTFADAHSIFLADFFGLPWERALTGDPRVAAVVLDALRQAAPRGKSRGTLTAGDRADVVVRPGRADEHEQLVRIWRAAVEQTHHFLTVDDIDRYEGEVRSALPQVADLRVAIGEDGRATGFIAQAAGDIHMLFVDPACHGQGVGTALVEAIGAEFGTLRVDVNEDNPSGRRFYQARGFEQVGRSATDNDGNPFPLLHLLRRQDATS